MCSGTLIREFFRGMDYCSQDSIDILSGIEEDVNITQLLSLQYHEMPGTLVSQPLRAIRRETQGGQD